MYISSWPVSGVLELAYLSVTLWTVCSFVKLFKLTCVNYYLVTYIKHYKRYILHPYIQFILSQSNILHITLAAPLKKSFLIFFCAIKTAKISLHLWDEKKYSPTEFVKSCEIFRNFFPHYSSSSTSVPPFPVN